MERREPGVLFKVRIDSSGEPEWMTYEGTVDYGRESFIKQSENGIDVDSWQCGLRYLQFSEGPVLGTNRVVEFDHHHINLERYTAIHPQHTTARKLLTDAKQWSKTAQLRYLAKQMLEVANQMEDQQCHKI